MSSRAASIDEVGFDERALPAKRGSISWVILVSFAILLPALIFGIPANKDLTNHFRFAVPFYEAIRSGNFYPGWLADSNSGFGDPSFRFYPPALYYLLALARSLTGNWYAATLVTFSGLSIAGGLGIYFWARSTFSQTTAMWAGIFFALAPYHINQLFQATLLAEYAGTAVLPFAFGFVDRICLTRSRRYVAGLAATYAVLLLTHLPLAIMGSMALLVYAVARLEKPNRIETLARLGLAGALGLAASAIYWVTMLSELGWIGINNQAPDASVDYRNNFLFSTFSADNLNVWWLNIIAVITLLLFAPALVLLGRKVRRVQDLNLKPASVVTAFAVFMAVPLSWPVWRVLPPLQQTQFPWRWLAIVSMSGSILAAASLSFWFDTHQKTRRELKIVVLGGVLVSVAFSFAHTVREAQYFTRPQFDSMLSAVRDSESVNYWIPVWVASRAKKMPTEIEVQDRSAAVDFWKPEHRRFSVSAGAAKDARVRTFFYPHWQASAEGQVLATRPDHDGTLLVSLPPAATSVDLQFREPARTGYSAVATACGWLIIGGLIAPIRRRHR